MFGRAGRTKLPWPSTTVRRKRVAAVDQLDQPRAVDMRIDLRGRDVGMAEQRLKHAQVRAAAQKVCRERMAKDVRADTIGRDVRVGGHLSNDLEQAHAAEVPFAAREQPQAVARNMLQPALDGGLGTR